jgi:hypothetical protein
MVGFDACINDALIKQKKGFGTCCAENPFSI